MSNEYHHYNDDERQQYKEMDRDSFLVDGGKTIIKCSTCDGSLAEIWIVKPNLPIKSKIIARCPFCGNSSFQIEVNGKFIIGHVGNTTISENEMVDFYEKDGIIYQEVLIKFGDKNA